MIEVVVAGALGRLGQRIAALVEEAPDLALAAKLERPGAPEGYTSSLDVITPGRVLVEAAVPSAVAPHVERASSAGAAILVATTGIDKALLRTIEGYADRVPVLIAPNLSLGVAVLTDLVKRASRALKDYQVEIVEAHHARKRDAPSGTAWSLARAAAAERGQDIEKDAILARAGDVGPRSASEIGVMAIRGGDIVGEHTVYFIGESERIELVHRAQDRDVFARGAVAAARFLGAGRAPGLYTMHDVLGL